MKRISETSALEKLARIRSQFVSSVRAYENKAKKCSECKTPGICCLDEHFVNVRITRIEAEAITRELAKMGNQQFVELAGRIVQTIERFGLSDLDDASEKAFACPLFEPGTGCLVHTTAKPLPCIAHACYEQPIDLPPENLLASAEKEVAQLNEQVYGRRQLPDSLPVAVSARLKK